MTLKNLFLVILMAVLAGFAWYEIIALIQWNWQFQTWHWAARLIWIILAIGAIAKQIKELKHEESNSNT